MVRGGRILELSDENLLHTGTSSTCQRNLTNSSNNYNGLQVINSKIELRSHAETTRHVGVDLIRSDLSKISRDTEALGRFF